jgi:2-aminoadipate transaminase
VRPELLPQLVRAPPYTRVMDTISLARGVPAPECIPVAELADCAAAAIKRDGRTVLSYGPVGGYQPLREWIAGRHGVEPSRVLVTNGSLQGLAFLADRFAGARVLVEQPTYDRPLKLLAARGADVTAVPMDDDGIDLDALTRALDTGPPPAFLYTIPTFQNPSGRTLTTERRQRLVELARERDLLVLEDDPYGLVRFEGDPPPTLFELDGGDHVVYSSSFSKTVAPGVRVGYFVLPQALGAELEALAVSTYITPVLLGQATVFEFLRRGNFEPNVERVAGLLRVRRDAMLDALEQELPSASWSRPQGGYFVWLELPHDLKEAPGVAFVPGTDFGGAPNTARLAFSYVSPDEIREGISRLSAALAGRGEVAAAGRASRGYAA